MDTPGQNGLCGATYLVVLALVGCGGDHPIRAKVSAPRDAGVAAVVAGDWADLGVPRVRPRWMVTVPVANARAIAVDVHGPMVVDGVAVVAGSRIGVVGIDLGKRAVAFQRPVKGAVPLPVELDGAVLAVGDCEDPVGVEPDEIVVGCYTVLDAKVEAVHGAGAIVAKAKDVEPASGPSTLAIRDRTVWLGTGDGDRLKFAMPDPPRGDVRAQRVARRNALAPPERPILIVGDGDDQVDLWIREDVLELRYHRPDVMSDRVAVVDIAGAVGALAPVGDREVRAFRLEEGGIQPVIVHVDGLAIDNLGAAVPGIALLGAAQGPRGFVLAMRLDATLEHDYVVGFTADGTPTWVYPLPPPPAGGRTAPVGVALSDDAVVVFHDGETVAALPLP